MTLEDFKSLANPRTGLVAMRVTRSFAPWVKGAVAGFPPAVAFDHFNNGDAVLYSPGDTPELRPAKFARPKGRAPKNPVMTETGPGDKVVLASARAATEPPATITSKDLSGGNKPVVLPDNWRDLHHLQIVKLATDNGFDKTSLAEGEKLTEKATEYLEKISGETKAEQTPPPPAV